MSSLRTLAFFAGAMTLQPRDPTQLRRLQEAKLRRIVRHAYATVPFYRRLWDSHRIDPASIRELDDLARLPLVTKAQLQEAGEEARISRAWPRAKLTEKRSSGSAGRPMSFFRDPRFMDLHRAIFWRSLAAGGLRPWHRLLLYTGSGKPRKGLPGWRYLSSEASPEVALSELMTFRPHMLYGYLTPLRRLALLARERGTRLALKTVFATAETIDPATRALLHEAFRAEVFDIYGCTETGALAWECGAHQGYHLAADTTVLECFAGPNGEAGPTAITHLELRGMPLVRYALDDLAVPHAQQTCPCGCRLPRLARIEGRLIDCIRLPGGRLLSPYIITAALREVPGLVRYQVVQRSERDYLVRGQGAESVRTQAAVGIVAVMHREIGAEAHVEIAWEDSLEPPAGRKFRAVECRMSVRHRSEAEVTA